MTFSYSYHVIVKKFDIYIRVKLQANHQHLIYRNNVIVVFIGPSKPFLFALKIDERIFHVEGVIPHLNRIDKIQVIFIFYEMEVHSFIIIFFVKRKFVKFFFFVNFFFFL